MAGKFEVRKNTEDGWTVGFYDQESLWWPVEDHTTFEEAITQAEFHNKRRERGKRRNQNGHGPT